MSTEQFVAALAEYQLDPTEIAEIIWLALHQPQPEAIDESADRHLEDEPAAVEDGSNNGVGDQGEGLNDDTDDPDNDTDDESQEEDTLYGLAPELPSGTLPEKASLISLPDADLLDETLPLVRAMKPLLKQIESQMTSSVNEAETVERIAETDIWSPVLNPDQEPWFEVALVIDNSPAMSIWQRLIQDIQRLLRCYGSFRNFRVWQLAVTKGEVAICAMSNSEPVTRSPRALLTPDARRLILVFSDCTANYWWDGSMQPTLALWGESTPTALWQVLPDWMWKRTALGIGEYVSVRNHIPGARNSKLTPVFLSLQSAAQRSWQQSEQEADVDSSNLSPIPVCVPVVTSEGKSIRAWSRMLAGDRQCANPGFLLPPASRWPSAPPTDSGGTNDSQAQEKLLETFRLRATSSAKRLAALLSAAPVITLPVMRLIRSSDELLLGSSPLPVAEVFLGGLLQKVPDQSDATNPERVQYTFPKEVQKNLLDILPKVDAVEVVEAVSRYVAEQLNCTLTDFRALLLSPDLKDEADRYGLRSFANMTATILKRKGGFEKLVQQLEGTLGLNNAVSELETDNVDWLDGFTHATLTYQVAEYLNFPALEPFAFEQCEFVEDGSYLPPLSTEEFTIRTLVRSSHLSDDVGSGSIRDVYTDLLQQYESEQSESLRENIVSALSQEFEDIDIQAEAVPSFGRHEQDDVMASVRGFTFESPIEITAFSEDALTGSSTLSVDVELDFTFSFYRYDSEDNEEMLMGNSTESSEASIDVNIKIYFIPDLKEREIEIDRIDAEIPHIPTIDLGEIEPDW